MMTIKQQKQKFYIFDYFLDGHFLKWEPTIMENLPVSGEVICVNNESGVDIQAKILETEKISEDECRIFLASLS